MGFDMSMDMSHDADELRRRRESHLSESFWEESGLGEDETFEGSETAGRVRDRRTRDRRARNRRERLAKRRSVRTRFAREAFSGVGPAKEDDLSEGNRKVKRRGDSSILTRRLSFLLVLLLAFALIYGPGFIELAKLNAKADRLAKYKEQLIAENQRLLEESYYYESNDYIEKAARQKLGMVKKGETLYVLADGIKDPSVIVERRAGVVPEIHN